MSRCSPGLFAGMSQDQLRDALAKAQAALIELNTGSKGVSFSYTQGNGTKTVTYQQTSAAQLAQLIQALQAALGMTPRARRPLRFAYR